MTQTQLQYLNYLEQVRANQAREALSLRQAEEIERANAASEGIRSGELKERERAARAELLEKERAARASEALQVQKLDMDATVNAARNALYAKQTDAAEIENLYRRLYDFDDYHAISDYMDQFYPGHETGAYNTTRREIESYFNVTRPSNYIQRLLGGEDTGGASKLMEAVTKLFGLLS